MNFSFYRNVTWLIGILVALEIFLKMGIHRGLTFIVADLVIVLVLTFLFHRLRKAGVSPDPYNSDLEASLDKNVINTKTESNWQRKHDQWWRTHRRMINARARQSQMTPPRSHPVNETAAASANVTQLRPSHQELKGQINELNRKIARTQNDPNQPQADPRHSEWYRQVKQIKQQIAQLKSEYK